MEEFPKSGSGLFLPKTLFHACAVTHRLKKAVRNDMKYGIYKEASPRPAQSRAPYSCHAAHGPQLELNCPEQPFTTQ